mmetsp:Transcript_10795/g.16420  ORF Transcript_10795/g.16420 Transcript_10795/m.16420 type:complete len:225 (+) Transcript_10795:248-922(+)
MEASRKKSVYKSPITVTRKYSASCHRPGISPLILPYTVPRKPVVLKTQVCIRRSQSPSPFCYGLRLFLCNGNVNFIEWMATNPSQIYSECEGTYTLTPGYFGSQGPSCWEEWGDVVTCERRVVFDDLYLQVQREAARRKYIDLACAGSRNTWSSRSFVLWLILFVGGSSKQIADLSSSSCVDESIESNCVKDIRSDPEVLQPQTLVTCKIEQAMDTQDPNEYCL